MSKEKEGDPHIYFLFYSSFLNRLPINYKKKSCNRAGPRYTHVKQLKNNQLHLHKNRTNCARIAHELRTNCTFSQKTAKSTQLS